MKEEGVSQPHGKTVFKRFSNIARGETIFLIDIFYLVLNLILLSDHPTPSPTPYPLFLKKIKLRKVFSSISCSIRGF